MEKNKYSITFACYNQVEYTKKCIDSMLKHGTPLDRVVAVDNASSDDTLEYLKSLPLGGVIHNAENLGCGIAWNQGALHQQAEWTVVMNNDVLVSAEWIERLIHAAEKHNLKVASPALVEGPLDYDFDDQSLVWSDRMRDTLRVGTRHAVCLAVHRSVWHEVGYFQPVPKLLGYEDTLFFSELDKVGIRTAITGAAWLHHYGSITQTAMKQERGLSSKQGLANRKNYRLLNQSWLTRKMNKLKRNRMLNAWREAELARYGMTLHGKREGGDYHWP
ncbi:glycosyltransferase family 2 protein [Burkholderia multivorans]|uniref:glycosyltransferase family 2 protein n=1 Tax=Burkholderia multivorans TaxID=87883 RepID=UPI00350F4A42